MAYILYDGNKMIDEAPTINNARRRAYNWMRAGRLYPGREIEIARIQRGVVGLAVGYVEYTARNDFMYFDNKKKKWHTFNLNTGELKK